MSFIPPVYAYQIPNAPIHPVRDLLEFPYTAEELLEKGAALLEAFLKNALLALSGIFIPGTPAFNQLQDWAHALLANVNVQALNWAAVLDADLGTGHTIQDVVANLEAIGSDAYNSIDFLNRQAIALVGAENYAAAITELQNIQANAGNAEAAIEGAITALGGGALATALGTMRSDLAGALAWISWLISRFTGGTGQTTIDAVVGLIADAENKLKALIPAAVGAGGSGFPWTFPIAFGTGSGFPWSFPVSFGDVEKGITDVGAAILNASKPVQDLTNTLVREITGVATTVDHSAGDLATAIKQLPASPPLLPIASGLGQVSSDLAVAAATAGSAASQVGAIVENAAIGTAAETGAGIAAAAQAAASAAAQLEDATANALAGAAAALTPYGSALSGFLGQLAGLWGGSTSLPPAPPRLTAEYYAALQAAQAAAAAAAAQAAQTAAIQAQLPHFYGGSGTSGLNAEISFSGLTSLPGTFTPVSTIAAKSAMYNVSAASTDQQTTSGIWTVADPYAKYLFLRANSGFTTYVYAKLQSNVPFTGAANCEIGCVVAGVRTVLQTLTLPGSGNFTANGVYALEATAYTFTVTGPNALSVSTTDGGHVSQLGSSYRWGGFGTDGTSLGQQAFTTSGTYNVAAGMVSGDKFDLAEVGGGGGSGVTNGGAGGAWNAATLGYGSDIPTSTISFAANVGAGGAIGSNGGTSSIVITGYGTLSASGGAAGGSGSSTGASPGNETFNNAGYTGGAPSGGVGNTPGGGGARGAFSPAPGAAGEIWITANSLTLPGSLLDWAFYDSGPTAGPATAFVATSESTSSTSYTDLATTTDQVTVNIGSSGMAIVFLYASLGTNPMSFAMSGANTQAPSDSMCLFGNIVAGCPFLVTGLSQGATTFKAKYRASSGTATFSSRRIAVIPL